MHGWRTWLSDLQQLLVHGDDAVLVTVAHTEGAAPREVGVKMVVARDRTFHTIGGGALEWRAIEFARRLLRDGGHVVGHSSPHKVNNTPCVSRRLERISLGESDDGNTPPGAATLAFERLTIADLAWVTLLGKRFAAGDISVRSVSFADDSPVLLSEALPNAKHADCLLWDAGPMMTETLLRDAFPVMVFGAGHVGSALVRVLATLPCDIIWVDDRPAYLSAQFSTQFSTRTGDALPPNVTTLLSDDPPSCVAQAPDGCSFVVMTYSDTLDQHIVESVLQQDRFDYLGVIGSYTKRHSFEQIFQARGLAPAQLRRMHCPIGIEGMPGSAPEIIAVSIAAQLLQHRTLARQPMATIVDDRPPSGATVGAMGSHTNSVHPVSTHLPDGTTVTTITTVTTTGPHTAQPYPAPSNAPSAANPGASSAGQASPVSPAYADWKPQ